MTHPYSSPPQEFVNEVLETIELDEIRDASVGIPGVNGLSTEQRKRLTIAVELVSNPSIIFMDEPTSGLDARAAAIVIRAVKNVADTGRTVVCTIHQPSIEIFEAFDEVIILHFTYDFSKILSDTIPGTSDLHFPTRFPQKFREQFKACLWKQCLSYWRTPSYNLVRMVFITVACIFFGALFWQQGNINHMYVSRLLTTDAYMVAAYG